MNTNKLFNTPFIYIKIEKTYYCKFIIYILMTIENINIAIIGPVSAGKSTFFNALCSNTCSEMKRKKTTMLPQIYQTSDKTEDSIDEIYKKNKDSNELVLKKREDGTFDYDKDFKEICHFIKTIPDFIKMKSKASYSILDMPGLNCGGDTLYYDYILKNSHSIDVYILVFDINSGLNTTDEINIIKMVIEQIDKNKNGYMHILINKCDEISFDKDKVDLEDDELNDLYERCIETITKLCAETNCKFTISPLCSSKLYIFRTVKNCIDNIDESLLDNIIKLECGKIELKKLKTFIKKKKFISGLLKSEENNMYNDWMSSTGYKTFQTNLNEIISDNYDDIIYYHINKNLIDINKTLATDTDMNAITDELKIINARISNLKSKTPKDIISNITDINTYLNTYLTDNVNKFTASTIQFANNYLDKIMLYYDQVKHIFKSNPLESSYKAIEDNKYKLYIDEFIKSFDSTIYQKLIYKDKLTPVILSLSINKALSQNIHTFNTIFNTIRDGEHIDIFIDIFITKYNTMNINEYLNCLEKILSIKNDKSSDLQLISKVLQLYFSKNKFFVCWLKLNLSKINECSRKIQYIYLQFDSTNTITPNCPFDEFNEHFDDLDKIYKLLCKYIDNVFDRHDSDTKQDGSDTKQNVELLSEQDSDGEIESDIKSDKQFVESNDGDAYYDSDSSDTIYTKASKNTAIRATKIMNSTA